jgi:hypothetical protein
VNRDVTASEGNPAFLTLGFLVCGPLPWVNEVYGSSCAHLR